MNTNFRKWKFKEIKKVFMPEKKLEKLINKKGITIYDTRHSIDFSEKKVISSSNVSPNSIKRVILSHHKSDYILLVGNKLRTNAGVASWARFEGYKHIYLLYKQIDEIDNPRIFT